MKQKIINGVLVCLLGDEDDTLLLKIIRRVFKAANFSLSMASYFLPSFLTKEKS